MSRCISFYFGLSLLFAATAMAKPTLSVRANKKSLTPSEFLLLDIEIEVKGETGEPKLVPPNLSDWERIRVEGTGTQQSISIINGRMSRSFTKNERWILKPKKNGDLVIDSFVLKGEGSTVRSQPIRISVKGDGTGGGNDTLAAGQSDDAGASADAQGNLIFLRWSTATQSPYVGQPMMVFLDLFYDQSLRPTHSNGLDNLDLSGFWSRKLPSTEQRETTSVIEGRQYNVQRLVGYRLVPLQAGERTLPSVSMGIELSKVRQRRGGFFRRQELVPWGEVEAKSEPFLLNVKALPTSGRPSDFLKTSVGVTSVAARVSQQRIRASSGVDLTVELKTTGLLENFPSIVLPELKDFEVYPGQIRDTDGSEQATRNRRPSQTGIPVSKRIHTFLLRPKRSGRLTIPEIKLNYFDPVSGTYKSAKTKPLTVLATGEAATVKRPLVNSTEGAQPQKNLVYRPLSPSTPSTEMTSWAGSTGAFFLILAGFPLIFLGVIVLERIAKARGLNSGTRAAARALKAAQFDVSALNRDNATPVGKKAREAKRIAFKYLSERTQASLLGLAYDDLALELGRLGASKSLCGRFVELFETFDYESFSGNVTDETFEQQLEELTALMEQFESELSV